MPKAKIHRKSTSIDMTPMVDLAFLLITFFMLTIKFRPPENVKVITPSSVAEVKIPNENILIITFDTTGRVFLSIDKKPAKIQLLKDIGQKYDLAFDEKEMKEFGMLADIGVPIRNLKQWLSLSVEDRKKNCPGIPCDSTDNQLAELLTMARKASIAATGADLRIAVKGDRKASAPTFKKVIATLQSKKINKFNLITEGEAKPQSLK